MIRWNLGEVSLRTGATSDKAADPQVFVTPSLAHVTIVQRDGLDVIYLENGVEKIGRIGKDIKPFEALAFEDAVKVLHLLPKYDNGAVRFVLRTDKGNFGTEQGAVGMFFYKKGGYRRGLAQLTTDEIVSIANGSKKLYYTKGTSNYTVK